MENEVAKILKEIKIKNIIIDFSCVNIIDSCGVDTIAQVKKQQQQPHKFVIFIQKYMISQIV